LILELYFQYTINILPDNLNVYLVFIFLINYDLDNNKNMPSTTIKVDIKVRDNLLHYKENFGSKTLSDTITILILKYEKLKIKEEKTSIIKK